MKRKIIKIDEELCNGCGNCVTACAESAIKIVDGKAKLISDQYCDGLGVCIGHCPTGALEIIEREADEFQLPEEHAAEQNSFSACQCPSLNSNAISNKISCCSLQSWPIQLMLIPESAAFLQDKELVIAADCTAFAMFNIKELVPENAALVIGCPKLDDAQGYVTKLANIFQNAHTKKVTVLRMEVPCCSGLTAITEAAIANSGLEVILVERIISIDGKVL